MMKMFVASFGAFVVMAASCFAGTGTLNVKRCETSFMNHLKRMEQEGRTGELSPEFKTVVNGMKRGKYDFDNETALKAMRQLYPRKEAEMHPRIAEKIEAARRGDLDQIQKVG